MSYCVEKGMPHDEWLSWSPESRAKHMAYILEDSESCQLCGTASWEWEENRFAYETQENFCQGCYMKEVAGEGRNTLPGTTINLVPVTEETRLQRYMSQKVLESMDLGDDQEGS